VKSRKKKGIEKFDKSIIDKIDKHWKKSTKQSISREEINKEVFFLCRTKISRFLKSEKKCDYLKLYDTASQHTPMLLEAIQKNGTTTKLVSKRLEILYEAVQRWHEFGNVKTPTSAKLQNWLRIATQTPTLDEGEKIEDLNEFLSLFEELDDHFSKDLILRIFKAFGDTEKDIEETISTLKMWSCKSTAKNHPAKEILDIIIRKACGDNILASKITKIEHTFSIPDEYIGILKNISPAEVRRCIKPLYQSHILFKKIVANGQVLHDEDHHPHQHHFWNKLFTKISENFSISTTSIKDQVAYFDSIKESFEVKDVDTKIPCFQILRLMTNSCWGVGDLFFRRFFPELTQSPYWTTAAKGIYCDVKTKSENNFAVTQVKTYTFYPLMNPSDKASILVDAENPLANLLIAWTVAGKNDRWRGKIHIIALQILKAAKEKDKWVLLESLTKLTHIQSCIY